MGVIQTPVYLCGTHAVGTVYHAAVLAAGGGPDNTVIPVVGECDDSDIGDSRTVTEDDVTAALADLGEDVVEGTVGAGTGMTCFDFAGGIGTASRVVRGHTVGVLLMCNFGDRERLTVGGLRFDAGRGHGRRRARASRSARTDAPLSALQLRRLSLRPLLGLAGPGRTPPTAPVRSAWPSPPPARRPIEDEELSPLFAAAYEAAEEAVYNCLVAAKPGRRRDGSPHEAFPKHLVQKER